METGKVYSRLKESKCHLYLQEHQEVPGKLQAQQWMLVTLSFQSFQGCIPNILKDKSLEYVIDKRRVRWPGN